MLFLDLDRFKVVNDSLGHPVGDQLLVAVAGRIETCIRPGDTVARLGGDEFAVLLEEIAEFDEATEVASRIHAAFTQPFVVGRSRALRHRLDRNRPRQLGERRPGRSSCATPTRRCIAPRSPAAAAPRSSPARCAREVLAQLQLENDLRRAIERQEFEVYYQPILALRSAAITGFEALVRWHHPERGLVEPAQFISAAEETGIIVPLGMWVLEEACRQLRSWREADPAWESAHHERQPLAQALRPAHLVRDIVATLERTGLPPRLLKLELTEGILVHNPQAANAMLKELRALGIGVCIDDFGTGYSSLSYLTSLNVDVLKIDRSFIHNLSSGSTGTTATKWCATSSASPPDSASRSSPKESRPSTSATSSRR